MVILLCTDYSLILESPVHALMEGESLTLRCFDELQHHLYKYRNASGDEFEYQYILQNGSVTFYKDGSLIPRNESAGEITIPAVSKSDEGFYMCAHPALGNSTWSWVTVRGVDF